MTRIIPAVAAFVMMFASAADAGVARFLSHPDLSPDGREIVFAWGGDLWRVPARGGRAQAITVHPAEEDFPLFSPDGKYLYFTSNRDGVACLYRMPAEGGAAERLTGSNNAGAYPYSFANGNRLYLYTSLFLNYSVMALPEGGVLVEVSREDRESHYFPAVSADASRMVFCRRNSPFAVARINYVGSGSSDLWMADLTPEGATAYVQLTTSEGQDTWPALSPDGRTAYWIAARPDAVPQVYRMSLPPDGSGGEPITTFEADALRCLRLSRDGKTLIFIHDFEIYTLATRPGSTPRRIEVRLTQVPVEHDHEVKRFENSDAGDFAVSPDDKKLAMIVDHDVYITSTDENPTVRQVSDTPERERELAWGSDSRTLVYTTMRRGNRDLVMYDTVTDEETVLSDTDSDEAAPVFSPDMAYLAYFDASMAVAVITWPTQEEVLRIPLPLPEATMYWAHVFDWSPDSRWLIVRQNEPLSSRAAWVYSVSSETPPRRLSPIAREMGGPGFSGNGDRVFYGAMEGDDGELFVIDLVSTPEEFKEDELEDLFADKKTEKKEKKVSPPKTLFDWDNLEDRTYRIGSDGRSRGSSMVALPESDDILVAHNNEVQKVSLARDSRGKRTRLAGGGGRNLQVDAKGLHAYWNDNGRIVQLDLKKNSTRNVPFTVRREVDSRAVRDAAFEEAWWALDRHFYDPEKHGVDWPAVRAKYEALLPSIRDNVDFDTMLEYMLGELQASHMNAYPNRTDYDPPGPSAAWVGLHFDPVALEREHRFVITEVEPRSPATQPQADIRVGEEIVSINGEPVGPGTDFYATLNGMNGRKYAVVLRSATNTDPATREIAVRPGTRREMWDNQYVSWVRKCRERTEEWSGGKLGYLHIRAMDGGSLDTFIRDLRRRLAGKEGAIIDVRDNGGGYIAFEVLRILAQKPWAMTKIRGNPMVSENWLRGYSLEMPAACLANESSFSNAEMFAEGFRSYGIGPVVGMPTGGGVIGTGEFGLVNGYRIRMPRVGVYTETGVNLENAGRRPDILVDITPADRQRGDDPQLRAAVEAVLARIK